MTKDPDEGARLLRADIESVASATDKPFAVNVPVGRDPRGQVLPVSDAYIRAVIDARASDDALARQLRVLTTSAGFPGEFRPLIRDSGLVHMHKVGASAHARKAEDAGVDVVIASGYEMGGHTHASPVHTFVLVPNITEAVSVPVVLSGGARDGRTLAAALALGASGVAMGTRFIALVPPPEQWLAEVLAAMGCRRSGRKWQCPAHGHTSLHSASLAIGARDDGHGAWVHCHAGCSVTAVLRTLGLRPIHLHRPPRVTPSRYVHLQGLRREWPQLKDTSGHPEAAGYRHEAWHPYGPDHAKQRLRRSDGSKAIRWESRNARGEWVPGLLGVREADLPLYREAEVRMAAAAGETVVLCESESSCDALHGVYATTWAGGAGSPPLDTIARILDDVDVVIIPDHDEAGLACLERLVDALPGARVLIGRPGEDARDLYARLGFDAFTAQLESAAGWTTRQGPR